MNPSTLPVTLLLAVALFAGCLNNATPTDDDPTATPSASSTPRPSHTNPPPPPGEEPGTIVAINRTGDAVVRFALTSDTPCTVVAAGVFHKGGSQVNFAMIHEGDGAAGWYSGAGISAHGAGHSFREGEESGTYAMENTIGGSNQPWGTSAFTIAVRNMTWFENEFTGPYSLLVKVDCEGPYTMSNLSGSREVAIIGGWTLAEGAGVQAPLPLVAVGAHLQDAWEKTMQGDNIRGFVMPLSDAMSMKWTTPTEQHEWRSTPFAPWKIEFEGPAGDYSVHVDASADARTGNTLFAIIADLPPIPDGQALA